MSGHGRCSISWGRERAHVPSHRCRCRRRNHSGRRSCSRRSPMSAALCTNHGRVRSSAGVASCSVLSGRWLSATARRLTATETWVAYARRIVRLRRGQALETPISEAHHQGPSRPSGCLVGAGQPQAQHLVWLPIYYVYPGTDAAQRRPLANMPLACHWKARQFIVLAGEMKSRPVAAPPQAGHTARWRRGRVGGGSSGHSSTLHRHDACIHTGR